MTSEPQPRIDPRAEMRELERLHEQSAQSTQFRALLRSSKWGERIHNEVITGIEQRRPASIEDGILFLEESPRYFRSGYSKAAIARKLKAVPLTTAQISRLQDVILRAASSAKVGPEFNEYARLAPIVATAEFVNKIRALRDGASGWSLNRLERLLTHCRDIAG